MRVLWIVTSISSCFIASNAQLSTEKPCLEIIDTKVKLHVFAGVGSIAGEVDVALGMNEHRPNALPAATMSGAGGAGWVAIDPR